MMRSVWKYIFVVLGVANVATASRALVDALFLQRAGSALMEEQGATLSFASHLLAKEIRMGVTPDVSRQRKALAFFRSEEKNVRRSPLYPNTGGHFATVEFLANYAGATFEPGLWEELKLYYADIVAHATLLPSIEPRGQGMSVSERAEYRQRVKRQFGEVGLYRKALHDLAVIHDYVRRLDPQQPVTIEICENLEPLTVSDFLGPEATILLNYPAAGNPPLGLVRAQTVVPAPPPTAALDYLSDLAHQAKTPIRNLVLAAEVLQTARRDSLISLQGQLLTNLLVSEQAAGELSQTQQTESRRWGVEAAIQQLSLFTATQHPIAPQVEAWLHSRWMQEAAALTAGGKPPIARELTQLLEVGSPESLHPGKPLARMVHEFQLEAVAGRFNPPLRECLQPRGGLELSFDQFQECLRVYAACVGPEGLSRSSGAIGPSIEISPHSPAETVFRRYYHSVTDQNALVSRLGWEGTFLSPLYNHIQPLTQVISHYRDRLALPPQDMRPINLSIWAMCSNGLRTLIEEYPDYVPLASEQVVTLLKSYQGVTDSPLRVARSTYKLGEGDAFGPANEKFFAEVLRDYSRLVAGWTEELRRKERQEIRREFPRATADFVESFVPGQAANDIPASEKERFRAEWLKSFLDRGFMSVAPCDDVVLLRSAGGFPGLRGDKDGKLVPSAVPPLPSLLLGDRKKEFLSGVLAQLPDNVIVLNALLSARYGLSAPEQIKLCYDEVDVWDQQIEAASHQEPSPAVEGGSEPVPSKTVTTRLKLNRIYLPRHLLPEIKRELPELEVIAGFLYNESNLSYEGNVRFEDNRVGPALYGSIRSQMKRVKPFDEIGDWLYPNLRYRERLYWPLGGYSPVVAYEGGLATAYKRRGRTAITIRALWNTPSVFRQSLPTGLQVNLPQSGTLVRRMPMVAKNRSLFRDELWIQFPLPEGESKFGYSRVNASALENWSRPDKFIRSEWEKGELLEDFVGTYNTPQAATTRNQHHAQLVTAFDPLNYVTEFVGEWTPREEAETVIRQGESALAAEARSVHAKKEWLAWNPDKLATPILDSLHRALDFTLMEVDQKVAARLLPNLVATTDEAKERTAAIAGAHALVHDLMQFALPESYSNEGAFLKQLFHPAEWERYATDRVRDGGNFRALFVPGPLAQDPVDRTQRLSDRLLTVIREKQAVGQRLFTLAETLPPIEKGVAINLAGRTQNETPSFVEDLLLVLAAKERWVAEHFVQHKVASEYELLARSVRAFVADKDRVKAQAAGAGQ